MTSYQIFGQHLTCEPPLITPAPVLQPSPVSEGEGLNVSLVRASITPEADLASAEPLYSSVHRVEGVPAFRLFRIENDLLLRLGQVVEFVLGPEQILGRTGEEPWQENLELILLGKVIALWNESNGRPALHAGTVAFDDSGIAFLGAGGAGKSTWTMAMIEAGASLLSDDLLIIQRRDDREWAAAGLPTIRAWPEHFDRLVAAWPESWLATLSAGRSGGAESIQKVHPEVDKWRLKVPEEMVSESGVPLRHIFVLEHADHADADQADKVVIEPVPRRRAMSAVLSHSFVSRLATAACGEARRLERLVELVRTVPISTLRYRSDLETMPEAASKLFDYLETSVPTLRSTT